MAVAYDAESESHAGTTGSLSEASFSWTHSPSGTARGVVVFVFSTGNTTNQATGVDYGGVSLTEVSGGTAVDSAGETGVCTAYFLGASLPSGNQTITVARNNNSTGMYAVAFTVTAANDTEVYEAGIALLQGDGTLAEQSVDDGTPGTNSLRFAGLNSGLPDVPSAGANSTSGPSIDVGARVIASVYETTAGQGSRNVGFSSGTSDDRAAVHLAVRELTGGGGFSPWWASAARARIIGAGVH